MINSDNVVEKILDDFKRKVFNHAYELGQEFPDDKDPSKVFDPCNAGDQIEAIKLLDAHYAAKYEAAIQEAKLQGEMKGLERGHLLAATLENAKMVQDQLADDMDALKTNPTNYEVKEELNG